MDRATRLLAESGPMEARQWGSFEQILPSGAMKLTVAECPFSAFRGRGTPFCAWKSSSGRAVATVAVFW
jgi:hypothetical protein